MKAVCHYCKGKRLTDQSNNLCVECFNAIVLHYAENKPVRDHYLETLLMGLKREPLEKLYFKAHYVRAVYIDELKKKSPGYLENIIEFGTIYEKKVKFRNALKVRLISFLSHYSESLLTPCFSIKNCHQPFFGI